MSCAFGIYVTIVGARGKLPPMAAGSAGRSISNPVTESVEGLVSGAARMSAPGAGEMLITLNEDQLVAPRTF